METFLFILIFVVVMLLLAYGAMTECHACHCWWTQTLESSTLLERWQECREVERDDRTENLADKITTQTSKAETITVTLEKRENKYRCRKCKAQKVDIEITEV